MADRKGKATVLLSKTVWPGDLLEVSSGGEGGQASTGEAEQLLLSFYHCTLVPFLLWAVLGLHCGRLYKAGLYFLCFQKAKIVQVRAYGFSSEDHSGSQRTISLSLFT